ncbi:MAG: prepilin peptidase [bacterium]|nr:prepilin peptidase [bacterium]
MTTIAFGVLGLIVGSFINVLVLRRGARLLSGRSVCMSCGKKIRWFDLIPVISWLALRGRCRACGSRISIQYPAVELSMGAAFALVGGAPLAPHSTVFGLFISAILIAITVYDLRHTIIPDAWVWSFNALALISIFLIEGSLTAFSSQTAFSVLAGPLTALPLFTLWLVSKGRWMGLGDAKLALGIGWLLGPMDGIYALLFAFVIGAIVSVFILLPLPSIAQYLKKRGIANSGATKSYTMKSEVPFGPFLIAACLFQWISLMYGISIPFLWQ